MTKERRKKAELLKKAESKTDNLYNIFYEEIGVSKKKNKKLPKIIRKSKIK